MTDYRTPQTLDVIVEGRTVFRQHSSGSSDYMEMGTDQHYAAIYARTMNPDLPDGVAATFRWSSKYGQVERNGVIPARNPVHDYLIPQTLERFGAREWEPASPFVADPLNPTDEELSAAIQRGLANGTLIDAADWMAQHAAELGETAGLI